jgi:hypothetical protein
LESEKQEKNLTWTAAAAAAAAFCAASHMKIRFGLVRFKFELVFFFKLYFSYIKWFCNKKWLNLEKTS